MPATLREVRVRWAVKLGFFVRAAAPLARAALRASWYERRLPLEELTRRLRDVGRWRRGARIADPHWLLASLDRTLVFLPPWRYGRCLRRSLLLLDLWGRCGLEPKLHLGVRRAGESRYEGHAWVTTTLASGEPGPSTSDQGYVEAFVL
jgi:hypothetical protein